MSLTTIVKCDIKSCKWTLVMGDSDVDGGEELLGVKDAMGVEKHFCSIEHLRMWASGYVSPYKAPPAKKVNV